ncbi:MAG: hypothetical protein VYE73_09030, partial [Acidobacteriota bacterium]|nr:hypothetical protein [Acidobacteriota bacterium]
SASHSERATKQRAPSGGPEAGIGALGGALPEPSWLPICDGTSPSTSDGAHPARASCANVVTARLPLASPTDPRRPADTPA